MQKILQTSYLTWQKDNMTKVIYMTKYTLHDNGKCNAHDKE